MATPQISGKYHFQVDLKGLCLPVALAVPDIPATPRLEELIGPASHRRDPIILDQDANLVETNDPSVVQERSQSIITRFSDTPANSLDANSDDEDSDQLGLLPVSTSTLCATAYLVGLNCNRRTLASVCTTKPSVRNTQSFDGSTCRAVPCL